MKRILVLAVLLSFFGVNLIFAQVKTVCSASGIELAYKKTLVQGNTITVHFTLTNNTGKDLNPYLEGREGTRFDVQEVEAHDDEGNCYDLRTGTMSVSIAKARIASRHDGAKFSFPNEIVVKGVISLKNVDENARVLKRIAFPLRYFDLNDDSYGRGYIILRNVPIPNED